MKKTYKHTINTGYCIYLICSLLMCIPISNLWAQSASFGSTFIGNGDELAVFDVHNFSDANGAFGAGIIGTQRTSPYGVFSFVGTSSYQNVSNSSFVDGYVRRYGQGIFIFPVGDNNVYRPFKASGVSNSTEHITGAYYLSSPAIGITSSLAGGNYTTLPSGAPFSLNTKSVAIQNVSSIEYWDVDGSNQTTTLSFSYDANSNIASITNNNLAKLTLVGWSATTNQWEVIPSVTDIVSFLGSNSTLTNGSISTTNAINPNDYRVITFGSLNDLTTVKISPKIALQGASSIPSNPMQLNADNLMRDDLRTGINNQNNTLLPTAEPYTALGFTNVSQNAYTANVTTSGNNAIVDWVLVELRSSANNSIVIARQAALIQRDGDIVDTDGLSPVNITAPSTNYFVAIRHRNHLGIMTASTVALNNQTAYMLDFTNPSTLTYGLNAQVSISGKNYMWAGNANVNEDINGTNVTNSRIIIQGKASDRSKISQQVLSHLNNTSRSINYLQTKGYYNTDVNMDGQVIAVGSTADNVFVNAIINSYPLNATLLSKIYIIKEQLP